MANTLLCPSNYNPSNFLVESKNATLTKGKRKIFGVGGRSSFQIKNGLFRARSFSLQARQRCHPREKQDNNILRDVIYTELAVRFQFLYQQL